MCIFLVLARRRLYVGMGIGFAGRGDENDRYRMVAEHGNGLCAWRRKSERQNTKWAEQTVRGEEEIGMAEHEMGRKSERQNTKWAEQTVRGEEEIGKAEHEMGRTGNDRTRNGRLLLQF
jgi:hypothetical protein